MKNGSNISAINLAAGERHREVGKNSEGRRRIEECRTEQKRDGMTCDSCDSTKQGVCVCVCVFGGGGLRAGLGVSLSHCLHL